MWNIDPEMLYQLAKQDIAERHAEARRWALVRDCQTQPFDTPEAIPLGVAVRAALALLRYRRLSAAYAIVVSDMFDTG